MSNYNIAKIYPNDRFANAQIEKLLQDEGIRRDPNLDYTCGMYDEDMNIIATGSLFGIMYEIRYAKTTGNQALFKNISCTGTFFANRIKIPSPAISGMSSIIAG